MTDAFNLTASASTYFETTWVGVPPVLYLWEAEDFDFTNGLYYNYPDPLQYHRQPQLLLRHGGRRRGGRAQQRHRPVPRVSPR